MNTVISVLEGFEKLAYKFLLSIIFIPKTIMQITINPGWVPDYVNGELKQEKSPFDEYISPVILLLVVALIPALIFNFLPSFGVTLSSPAEQEPTADRFLIFEAETTGKSGSNKIFNEYSWYVERITGHDESGNTQYEEIYRETYNELTNKTEILENNKQAEFDGPMFTYLEYPNQNYNTSKNTFFYEFPESGDYYVNIEVLSFDPRREDGAILEHLSAFLIVNVPTSDDQQITVSRLDIRGGKTSGGNISDLLKKETTIFLALGLLFPPLLFAMATKLFRGEEISENMLRENFYAQCYYFSPLSLAIWATYYAWYFFTPDVFYYRADNTALQIILLPSLLAVLWFIGTETQAVARARQTKGWKAFLIVIVCTISLGAAGYWVYLFVQPYSQIQNNLRLFTIVAYPLAAGVLVIAFGFAWFRRRMAENRKMTFSEVALIAAPLLFLCVALNVIPWIINPPFVAPTAQPTQGADLLEPVPLDVQDAPTATEPPIPTLIASTSTIPAIQRFYTEEFDTNDNNWTYFVVDGATSTITKEDNPKMSVLTDNSLLTFDLNAINLWVYVIYDSFEYDNVRVDARVTNRGVNTNNVTLICRYTEDGWYEFSVANSGLYWIYAASVDSAGKVEYGLVYDGGSDKIKSGKETNEYSIICNGPTLSLFINGTEARTVTENKYGLTSGKVGISVAAFDVLPVTADLDWVTISEP